MKKFIKEHWKYLLGLAVVLVLLVFGYREWQEYKNKPAQAPTNTVVTLPQQTIHTNTETVREVAVQTPSTQGAILQFVERQGKVIAIVNGQEVEVPNMSGQPNVKIGENGELSISTSSTARIDVTEMANAQAQLIANQELEMQAKINNAEMKKEKQARKNERLLWIIGTATGGYLLSK